MKYSAFIIGLLFPVFAFASCTDFPRDLKQGVRGADVFALQRILNSDAHTLIAKTGPGSPGSEQDVFGEQTTIALKAFQTLYGLTASVPGVADVPTRIKLSRLSCEIDVAPPQPVVATSTKLGSGICTAIPLAPQPRPKVVLDQPVTMKVRRGDMFSLFGKNFTENNTVDVDGKSICTTPSSDGGRRIDIMIPRDAALGEQYIRVTDKYGVSNLIKVIILEASDGQHGTSACLRITRTLSEGSKGEDVLALQKFLNSDSRTQIDVEGSESLGKETEVFTAKTKNGVKLFQKLYAADILRPAGLVQPNGVIGALARNKISALTDCPVEVTLPPSKDKPVLSGVSPATAAAGDQIIIRGSNFASQNTILFGGKVFGPYVSTDGKIIVLTLSSKVPVGKQDIKIRTSTGTSNSIPFTVTSTNGKAPKIVTIDPLRAKPGATIRVVGSGFTDSGNDIVSVDGSIGARGLTATDKGTALSFTVPASAAAGMQIVKVVNANGQSNTRAFTIEVEKVIPPPTIDTLTPNTAKQGATVMIEGHNFIEPVTVYIDKVPLANVHTAGGSTRILLTVPMLTATGTHQVSVGTVKGESNSKQLEVIDKNSDVPVIERIDPASAQIGDTITITGRNFKQSNFINLESSFVGSAQSSNEGTVATFVLRFGDAGMHALSLSNVSGKSNEVPFTITAKEEVALPPVITTILPETTIAAGSFQLFGNNFGTKASVHIGTLVLSDLVTTSSGVLSVNTPTSLTPGTYQVWIVNAGGTSNKVNLTIQSSGGGDPGGCTVNCPPGGGGYDPRRKPVIYSLSPNKVDRVKCLASGGIRFTINGTNFSTSSVNVIKAGLGGEQQMVSPNGSTLYFQAGSFKDAIPCLKPSMKPTDDLDVYVYVQNMYGTSEGKIFTVKGLDPLSSPF